MKHIFSFFKFFPFRAFFLILLLIIAWLFLNRQRLLDFWQAYERRNNELAAVEKLEHQRKQLQERQQLLERTSLETERLVREKFKMRKPEEKIILLR